MGDNSKIDLIMISKFGRNDGGTETWFYNFFPALLLDRSIKLTIYGYRCEGDEDNTATIKKLESSGIHQFNPYFIKGKKNRIPNFFYMFRGLRKHLKKNNQKPPNITIAVGIFELIMMLTNQRFKNGLRIVWLRSIFLNEKSERIPKIFTGIGKKILCFLLKKTDVILANGDDIKKYYEELGLQVKVIKNGVNSIKWSMPPPELIGKIKVAYVGRLSKIKGIESYFELIKKIKESSVANKFEFHIVGDSNSYSSKVAVYEKKDWIKFHGNIENEILPTFLKDIDVCVAFTYSSNDGGGGGTSNALMEQMSAAKIIIAWDNAIFRQLLDNENAFLVKQHSISGLCKALQDIYENQDQAIRKGIEGKKTIVPYTIEAQIDKFKTLIANTDMKD